MAGGGISGLVAALRLSQAGVDVTVVEPDRLGGKVQTSMVAGRPVDEAADAFLLRVPWALALCHDLELDGELVSPAERQAHVFVDGHRRLLPSGHVLGVPTDLDALAASGLVSPASVERARRDLDLGRLATDPSGPEGDAGLCVGGDIGDAGGDVAVGAYLRGRLGDEVVDRLVDPLVGGINAGDTAALSLAAVVPQLDAAARSGDPSLIRSCRAQRERIQALDGSSDAPIFATPIGGMARLVDALLAFMPGVDIRTGRHVVAVDVAPSERAVVTLDDASVLEAGAVVLALPAHVAGPLLRPVAPEAADLLAGIGHASVSMLTLAFDRGDVGEVAGASGCLIPRDQGALATAVSYATSKWAQLRDPGRDDVILRVSAGRHGDDRHLDLDDADLTARILDDLDQVIGINGGPTEVRVSRWPRSFPQYAPGHLRRVDTIETALAATPVRLAGMALRGVGIPACIRSAEDAATALGATWPTRRSLTT